MPTKVVPDRSAFDVAVVGGGPAGLSAALWAARYRRRVVVVDAGHHRNAATEASHGYLGADGISPRELREAALRDLASYPNVVVMHGCSVDGVLREGGDFALTLTDGRPLSARRIVLATGVRDRLPSIEGFDDHYGASAFHCATCDGYEARGKHVVALGWSANVPGFALGLLDWASSVTVVTAGAPFEGEEHQRGVLEGEGVRVVERGVVRCNGPRGALTSLTLDDGSELDCEMLFFSIGHEPQDILARSLGCELTDEGCVLVDAENQTSVPGVYAAGDLTPGMQLVQVAAAKGAVAGIAAAQSLRGEHTVPRSPPAAPEPDEAAPRNG